jgi:tRNA1Val (adenine37-N6)-methyltransferase
MTRKKDHQFHFKQFSVRHDRSGMKIGTDGVLLGAWTNVTGGTHILDIGAGTGVIALMLAQRTHPTVKIEAIEIDEHAFADAAENFASSPWHERLKLYHESIHNFASTSTFDLIVSNPPFFQNSFKPPDPKRGVARHTENLNFESLLKTTEKLLSADGRLSVILPFTEGLQFISLADQTGFYCSRKWSFRTRKEKPVERLLMEFSRHETGIEEGEILLLEYGESWSEEYKNLTRDFYLKI